MDGSMTCLPATGLSGHVASAHSASTAPTTWLQGTGVSAAGTSSARVRIAGLAGTALSTHALVAFGARVASLPGSPPRGAPV